MKYIPINWEIVRNPLNWAIVLLMLAIAGFALNEMMRFLSPNSSGSCGCDKSQVPIPAETTPA